MSWQGWNGVIYTGLLDGRILAVEPEKGAVREVANTSGRPLGLEATADGRLLICDSPKGLLELDITTGALKTLVTRDGAERLVSTMRYAIHDWKKDIVENLPTGRVYRRAPDGAVTRLMDGLRFANGLVLARDGKSLIVAETAGCRLLRLWLAGDRTGTSEALVNLPGFPDNLGADDDGPGSLSRPSRTRRSKACTSCRSLCAGWRRACRRAYCPSRRAWPGSRLTTSAERPCTTLKTDGGYAIVTGVCRVRRRVWCAGLQERALMRFDLPGSV